MHGSRTAGESPAAVLALGAWLLAATEGLAGPSPAAPPLPVFPARTWEQRTPESVDLAPGRLRELAKLVGGRGCVARHGALVFEWGDVAQSGDIASAMKPVLSTLLLFALQEGRIASVDGRVADFEPGLEALNGGKDAAITWRHLASQTSGYGLQEPPGAAYAYNDYALALYYDVLTRKVFGETGTKALGDRLAGPLQFEDPFSWDATGAKRPGRLALSVRDFARFGLFYLRHGRWGEQRLLASNWVHLATHSPIPATLPRTTGQEADMLPGQRTLGGTRNITPTGPGYYSFNWWLNRTNRLGQPLFPDLPGETYAASGHGGKRVLLVVPPWDLIVSWNDSGIDDHDRSPEDPNTRMNQAARLIRRSVVEGRDPRTGVDK